MCTVWCRTHQHARLRCVCVWVFLSICWLHDSHSHTQRHNIPIPPPHTHTHTHPTPTPASRAGQLVTPHAVYSLGGGARETERKEGEGRAENVLKGWGKRGRSKSSVGGGGEIEVNKGKRTAGTNKCFCTGWQLLFLCVCVCHSECVFACFESLQYTGTVHRGRLRVTTALACQIGNLCRRACAGLHAY